MADLVANMRVEVLKEPLGFMRVLQFPLAILAFATTTGFSGSIAYKMACPTNTSASVEKGETVTFGYPFGLDNSLATCKGAEALSGEDVESSAKFFVCTGVLCFLYVIAILGVYLLRPGNYDNDARYPMGDFAVTAILALFWFISSCAWANGVSRIKGSTAKDAMEVRLCGNSSPDTCFGGADHSYTDTSYGALNVSLIAGFANFFLWSANLWFIYKETAWFKSRQAPMGMGPPGSTHQGSMGAGSPAGGIPTGGQGMYPTHQVP